MTTYLLLALTDNGRSEAKILTRREKFGGYAWIEQPAPLPAAASGNDRGQYETYEIDGWSIDAMRLPGKGDDKR